ncbi:hypothetical protein FH972_022627 [Carpinus fangiana]|uniref:Uncharacterized protein n=1 Tax=Carpinus fangiana TaxID=176857 RepID=A0A5N6KV18_9ROSI|nr:hypothetical protein FH972_022627 [Carpinus fangiana]
MGGMTNHKTTWWYHAVSCDTSYLPRTSRCQDESRLSLGLSLQDSATPAPLPALEVPFRTMLTFLSAALLALLALPQQSVAWPAQMGHHESHLEPLTVEQQERLRELVPPVMDTHYNMPMDRAQSDCPANLIPRIFPADAIAFSAATAYCSSMLAATAWHTVTHTPTAYILPNTIFTVPAPQPTPPPESAILKHVARFDGAKISSAYVAAADSDADFLRKQTGCIYDLMTIPRDLRVPPPTTFRLPHRCTLLVPMASDKKGPTTAKVSDIISSFAPTRKFGPAPGQKPYSVTSLDFDDTGELALVAQDNETLQIYNCKEGLEAKELKSQKYGVDLARFGHHSASIFYASTKGDDNIRYLSSHDNSYIRYFRGHTAPVTCLALSPSNDNFLSASLDDTVRLWDMQSQSAQGILKLKQPTLCAYDPTATVLAIACPLAQQILLYDVRNFDKPPFTTFDLQPAEHAHGGGPHAGPQNNWAKLEFSNDGKRLLLVTTGPGHYLLDAFSGKLLAFCARPQGPTGRLPPAQWGELRERQRSKSAAGLGATGQGDACMSPDGRYVIGGSGEHGLCVWDAAGREAGEPGARDMVLQPLHELGSKVAGRAAVVAYNPRHNLVVTADKAVVFWLPDMD